MASLLLKYMKTKGYSKLFSLRIVLIPERKLSSVVIELATKCAKFGEPYYTIDGKKYLPHLTIYFGSFPIVKKRKVFSVVNKISKEFTNIKLEYKLTKSLLGWLWIEFKLKGNLKKMHKEMLLKLSSLGKVHPYNREENYKPHISLLKYKNYRLSSKISKLQLNINKDSLDASWTHLALANSEEHGTVSKILKKYKLK